MSFKLMKKLITLLAAVCLLSAANLGLAWGESEVTIAGNKCGLVVKVSPKTVDTGNLNPGDEKYSSLRLINTGDKTITVYIRTNIKKEEAPRGGYLADIMTLTIRDGSRVLADDLFREVAKRGNILIGKMAPGEEKMIEFEAQFPKEANNDYQGATMKVNWTFVAECSGNGGDDGDNDGGNGGGDNGRPKPPPVDEEEPIPPEPDEPIEPEAIDTPEESIPFVPGEMPATGEVPSLYYYGAGAALAMLGLVTSKKK